MQSLITTGCADKAKETTRRTSATMRCIYIYYIYLLLTRPAVVLCCRLEHAVAGVDDVLGRQTGGTEAPEGGNVAARNSATSGRSKTERTTFIIQ